MLPKHLILCCPLFFLPSVFLSIRVFPNESPLHIRCPNYWRFSFSISPSSESSQLICFRIDWFDLLELSRVFSNTTVQKLQFLMIQLSHPYMTTGKTIALTIRTFTGKVLSLLFNMLSRFVIPFLPRSKCLLISWLQSPSTVILEHKKIKSVTVPISPHLFAMK